MSYDILSLCSSLSAENDVGQHIASCFVSGETNEALSVAANLPSQDAVRWLGSSCTLVQLYCSASCTRLKASWCVGMFLFTQREEGAVRSRDAPAAVL